MGGGKARKNFSRKTRIVPAKNVGNKIKPKKSKITFLIFTQKSSPKNGKKRAKQFFQKHTNSAVKKWEKIVSKKCEKRFLYSHEYRDQKMG